MFDATGGGKNVIGDFTVGQDHLEIAKGTGGVNSAADVLSKATTDANGNVVIQLDNDYEITLLGITLNELDSGSIWMG